MPNSKFDIYLGTKDNMQGYRVRQYTRDSAPLVASRFSTGAQGQTDLDLLKAVSSTMAGGMFQRTLSDPQKVARAIGVFNKYDENLYPAPALTEYDITAVNSAYRASAKCENEIYVFLAYYYISGSIVYHKLVKITKGGLGTPSWSSITLPSTIITTGNCHITDMSFHKGYLYVSGQAPVGGTETFITNHRYDIQNNTWQDLGGYGVLMRSMRGVLYHINKESMIYAMSNETAASAATYTFLDYVGFTETNKSVPTGAEEFNGALWIAKPDGLYRFDGFKSMKILSLFPKNLTVFNGALYFEAAGWLYRFDGTTVERLQYFGSLEKLMSISASSETLLVQTFVPVDGGYISSDKGTTVSPGTGILRHYSYDGAAFYILSETSIDYVAGYSYAGVVAYIGTKMLAVFQNNQEQAWYMELSQFFDSTVVTSSCQLEYTASEFDDGFPNVLKSAEAIEVLSSGLVPGDVLTVKYQLYDGDSWSSWYTAGTITSTTSNLLEIVNDAQKLFLRIRVNVKATSIASGSTMSVKGGGLRYTLQPRTRWRWNLTLMATGNGIAQDRANVKITDDSNFLSNQIVNSIKSKTAIFLFAPDYGVISVASNNADLTLDIGGRPPIVTDPYGDAQYIAVKNHDGFWEILRVASVSYNAGSDVTTITVKERGYLTTPAALDVGAEFHICYKVYVTRLLRDTNILDQNSYSEQNTGESQLQREFMLELVEV